MNEGTRHVRLGVFVVVTFGVLVAVLFLLGGRKLFQPTFTFETYFDRSVAGLEVGAPVRFRGVPLGQVTEIRTSAATYEADVPLGKRREYILVRAKVNLSAEEAEQMKRDVPQMVKKGLRAQTQLAGLTGQQYLSIDFFEPGKHPPLEFEWTPKYTYLPSAPSLASEIVAHAQAFVARLNEADIETLSRNLNTLVTDVDRKVNEVPAAELAARAEDVLKSANSTFERVDRMLAAAPLEQTLRHLDSASSRLDALLAEDGDVTGMLRHIDTAAGRVDALIGDNQHDIGAIVQDLRATSDNLRTLSESVKRYPAGALVGGPPREIQIPRTSR
jgi:ABC-type transporter Mla subunit MlaD